VVRRHHLRAAAGQVPVSAIVLAALETARDQLEYTAVGFRSARLPPAVLARAVHRRGPVWRARATS